MRVLKEVHIERKHKCKYCKSIFAYKEDDVDRSWDSNKIVCPVCKHYIPISIFDKKVKGGTNDGKK